MYTRMAIIYLVILLFDLKYSAQLHINIKRKGDNEEHTDTDQDVINIDKLNTTNEDTSDRHLKEEEINSGSNNKDDDNIHNENTSCDKDVGINGNLSSENNTQETDDELVHSRNKQTKIEEVVETEHNDDDIKINEAEVRPYKVGDTFTPQELLPVAIKLRSKVNKPGSGKGFVSSSNSPEQLADKLFEAFFMTFKRIVTLGEPDISGLDALQALALSGEAIKDTSDSVTEPAQTKYLRGQFIKIRNKPKTSKFKLIMKRVDHKEDNNSKRRGIELAKKLRKQRRLVINKYRREQGDKLMLKKKSLAVNKRWKGKDKNHNTEQKESACHWRYKCSDPSDLDTCQLFTECVDHNKASKGDYIAVPHKEDEHSKAIQQFRKMLKITVLDEEVEKILENRIIRLKPNSLNAGERVESLSEYFNNIVMEQELGTTTALSPSANDDDTDMNNDNETEEQSKKDVESDIKNEAHENQQDAVEIRKSLKFPNKSTPHPK